MAAAIFVGAAAVLLRLLSLGVENADFSQRLAEGVLLVENRFAEYDAGISAPASGNAQTDSGFPNWQYDVDVSAAGDYLSRVTLTAQYAGPMSGPVARLTVTRLFFDAVAAAEAADEAAASAASSSSSSPTSSAAAAGGS